MGKWINVTGHQSDGWYVDDLVQLDGLANDITTRKTVSLPLREGGTLLIRLDKIAFLAYGDDDA